MRWRVITLLLVLIAGPAVPQLGLPDVGGTVGGVTGTVGDTLGRVEQTAGRLGEAASLRSVQALARARIARLDALVRAHPREIERDAEGMPARRGVVLLVDPDADALARARALGFADRAVEGLAKLGLAPAELLAPAGMTLAEALARLRAALPDRTFSSDPLYGQGAAERRPGKGAQEALMPALRTTVGLIDSGVADSVPVAARRGFASGGPVASDHGTAIAALLRAGGITRILAADVYGSDPAGGGALSIARALDWLAAQDVRIVSISLVGPRNALLERAVAAAQARGMMVFAAVGNDGPAAPPAYPASYGGVFAITGVDRRDRALIEAGRALHLDYAAPGADLTAPDARGRTQKLRGTSFAVPLAAARGAAALDRGATGAGIRAALDAEARDLGRKGPDTAFGRGLLCGRCVRR